MFNFIKEKLKKIYSHFSSKLGTLFGRTHIDENSLKELEILLISSDTGVKTTRSIIQKLKANIKNNEHYSVSELKKELRATLLEIVEQSNHQLHADQQLFL